MYDANFPQDDSYLADFPSGAREQSKQLKEGQIVDAGMLIGLTAGNKAGQIPINNGNENINLNAAKLNGKSSSDFAVVNHIHSVATQSSNGFMSNADKIKLDSIASGATGSQNVFFSFKVGNNYIQPESPTDTLEISAGKNISVEADTLNDKITINVSGTVDTALKATQDASGNNIENTYLKRSGGTITGNINASGSNITANTFIGNLNGTASKATSADNATNAKNAQKAVSDALGQQIDSTYVKDVTSDGSKITVTKGDGNSSEITVTDLNKVYPVGSIYMSTVNTNPATLFGIGTWEAMPAGRVLLAQGTSDLGTFNAGSTGGEVNHTLSWNEMPVHNHGGSTNWTGDHVHDIQSNQAVPPLTSDRAGRINLVRADNAPSPKSYNTVSVLQDGLWMTTTGGHSHSVSIDNAGSGWGHNNMQPYLAVYMWQRTA